MPRRSKRSLVVLLGCAAVVALMAAGPGVLSRSWSAGRIYSEEAAPKRDVGIVLGAGVRPSGMPSAFLQARLDVAARLWRDGKIAKIIVSGNREAYYDEPRAMRKALIKAGVPAGDIVDDPAGFDTYDSCVRARTVFGAQRVTMISQTYHLPRSVATCRLVGVDAIGVGDDTMRAGAPLTWYYGDVRELAASWKMLLDVVTARQPQQ